MAVRKREWVTRKGEAKEAWVAEYTDGSGKRRLQTFAKKKDADAYFSKVKVDINAGTHVALDNNLTIADVAAEWLKDADAHGLERTTRRQYRQHVNLHIVPRIGAVKLKNLTDKGVKKFRDDLLSGENKLSPALARKVWVSFKSILKSKRCGHLAGNVKMAAGNRHKEPLTVGTDIPTVDEMKRLIEASSSRPLQCMFLKVAALTGLRASELLGLRWSDIDFKANELSVSQRADTRYREIGSPKSVKGRRKIPFGHDLALALKKWRLACPKSDLDLVFCSRNGSVKSYRNFVEGLESIFVAAHVLDKHGKAKYAPHAFRHFFASWCINPRDRGGRELPAKVVQEWLGHSSIKMTLDIYGHLFPQKTDSDEIRAAEKVLLG